MQAATVTADGVQVRPVPLACRISRWCSGGTQVVGSSPEMLVRVEGRAVTTHPIAGTRPRGRTEEEDVRLAEADFFEMFEAHAATVLAGAPIAQTPPTWEPYGRLVRAVADVVLPADEACREVAGLPGASEDEDAHAQAGMRSNCPG